MSLAERFVQNLVLAEEAGETRYAGNRKRSDEERPVRDGQVALESAHVADVLLAVHRVNHGARSQEQQRLEERVGIEVEDTCAEGTHAHREEHQAELRDRGIRQDALDVVLDQADRARHQRRQRPDDRNDQHRLRRVAEEHRVPADHVDARRHHRRRVDQCGDRRRPFHGVREPRVQRYLRRLSGGPDEQQQRGDRQRPEHPLLGRERGDGGGEPLEIERAEVREEEQHAEHERVVANPVDDERLLAGVGRRFLREPEADQQIRTEPDPLPSDEQHQEVGAEHQDEHEGRKQVQIRKVAGVLTVDSPRACTQVE